MNDVTLVLPSPPRILSPNSRGSWQAKHRARAPYRWSVTAAAWEQLGTTRPVTLAAPVTAHVTFIVTTDRKRDEDNALARVKALFDGLVDSHLLAGDDAEKLHIVMDGFEMGKKAAVKVRLSCD